MVKIYLTTILFLLSFIAKSQTAASLNIAQSNPLQNVDSDNIMGIRFDGSAYRMYGFNKWAVFDTVGKFATKTALFGKVDKTISINGKPLSANVSLSTSDIAEGTNQYYTNARSRAAISITTSGTTNSYNSSTGVINIANYNPAVQSVFGRNGIIISTNGDYTTDQITEVGNKFYTDARARASLSQGTGITYNNSSGLITNSAPDQTVSITGLNGLAATGTYPNFTITRKKQETYSGTTIAAGTYTVTFPVAYSVAPNIQANITNGTDTQNIRTTAISTTGFTVLVRNRVDVVGLLPSWANVSGATVDVLITEK